MNKLINIDNSVTTYISRIAYMQAFLIQSNINEWVSV